MTNEENRQLVSLLGKCQPGNLSHEVFEAVGRVAVYPAIEFIPLRRKNGKVQVLLYQRPETDIVWPSLLHTPGTVLRPTDKDIKQAFDRLYEDELVGLKTKAPRPLGFNLTINSRGRCILLEYLVEVETENPTVGVFYDVESLPQAFIKEQHESLKRAVEVFNNGVLK